MGRRKQEIKGGMKKEHLLQYEIKTGVLSKCIMVVVWDCLTEHLKANEHSFRTHCVYPYLLLFLHNHHLHQQLKVRPLACSDSEATFSSSSSFLLPLLFFFFFFSSSKCSVTPC
jgi:hypothetical protein